MIILENVGRERLQDILFVEKSKTKDFVENHDFDAGVGEDDTIVCFFASLDHFENIDFETVVGDYPGTTANEELGRSHGEVRRGINPSPEV